MMQHDTLRIGSLCDKTAHACASVAHSTPREQARPPSLTYIEWAEHRYDPGYYFTEASH
jgi:hypothetical protein